jgi:hypothetical protein
VAAACSIGVTGAGARAAVAPPTPTFAKTVVLTPISGVVSILPPPERGLFRLIAGPTVVPVGTLVDTTAGRVRLTSADPGPKPAKLQSGQFFRGVFQVRQSRTAGGLVNLVIRDNLTQSACESGAPGAARRAAVNRKVLGLLRGTAKGHFQTTGRFAAATVRGTDWGVRDRCDGTLTVVRRGVVAVRDFRRHKTVIVRAGQTYLAKAG